MKEALKTLADVAQGMSNAAASTVSAPVDLIAWLLKKGGLDVGKPAMGSDWMAERGLTRQPTNALAGYVGEGLGAAAPSVLAAKAPQVANALVRMGDNLAAPRTLNPQQGAIVWHGSPHKFDKFDSSKIGTGEGAQAYGHGLYLAESPDVALQYQRALSGRDLTEVGGKKVSELPISDDAKSFVNQVAANIQRGKTFDQAAGVLKKNIELGHPNAQAMQEALAVLGSGVTRGSLYKVDLPDDAIARMLDWYKPLSQQAPAVRSAIQRTRSMLPPNAMDDLGGDLSLLYGRDVGADSFLGTMNSLQENLGETLLRKAGVPGVRYLDSGSRGAGSGTSNFVVFPGEEGLLTILERNGAPIR